MNVNLERRFYHGLGLICLILAIFAATPGQAYNCEDLFDGGHLNDTDEFSILDTLKSIFTGKKKRSAKRFTQEELDELKIMRVDVKEKGTQLRRDEEYIGPSNDRKRAEKPVEKDPLSKFTRDEKALYDRITSGKPADIAIREFYLVRWISRLQHNRPRTVSFAVGDAPAKTGIDGIAKFSQALQNLRDQSYLIFYDADAPSANLFSEIEGQSTIGISATRSVPDKNIFQISNPYFRMMLLAGAAYVVGSTDSPVGVGLVMNNSVNYVMDPQGQWRNGFAEWTKDASQYFGSADDKIVPFREGIFPVPPKPKPQVVPDFAASLAEDRYEFFHSTDMRKAMDYEKVLVNAEHPFLAGANNGVPIPEGAVCFGSARNVDDYIQLVYDVAYYLGRKGVPMTTGGSGGFMEVANAGAFDAGAFSVGIPLGDKSLKDEKNVAKDNHTHTLHSIGYETRIPLLLANRQLIILAPGGIGTIKELATTLVMLGGESSRSKQIVFLGSKYYRDLVMWLVTELDLPADIRGRIHLVDHVEELEAIVEEIETHPDVDLQMLQLDEPPKPRRQVPRTADDFRATLFGSETKSDRDKKWRGIWH